MDNFLTDSVNFEITMQSHQLLIEKIKNKFNLLQQEDFWASKEGTHHKVFLSRKYAIRFKDDNPKLLLRETSFLKKLDHPLIPKVLWAKKFNKSMVMIENRLPGEPVNLVWKTLRPANKIQLIKQLLKFLKYLRAQKRNYIYSVNSGRKYKNFFNFLTANINQKIARIKKFKKTNKIMRDLLFIINQVGVKDFFTPGTKIALVHGDLIIHNLLTDGKNLTGILDWELALYGDPDYDLFRLFYYQECAKAYQEQGTDETFEADFMDRLMTTILKSNLIKNQRLFQKKYRVVRAIFYLNALYWAANSDNPGKNFNELINQWNKKSG